MASRYRKPRRIPSFICLIMGLLILVSLFIPVYTTTILGVAETEVGVSAYDMMKAVLNKETLLGADIETGINDIVSKVFKVNIQSNGLLHSESFQQLKNNDGTKIYSMLMYYVSFAVALFGAFLVLFGLLGTLFRAKLFRGFNIASGLFAFVASGTLAASVFLLRKPIQEMTANLMTINFAFASVIMLAASLISLMAYMLFRNKR